MNVRVSASREAIFGEEGVEVRKVAPQEFENGVGLLTGRTLIGYCEVEMPSLDGGKHWYPVDQLRGEKGETIKEEEIPIDLQEASSEDEGAEEE